MNQRILVILMIALLVSGAATYLVYRTVASSASRGPTPTAVVIKAARPLEIGTLIKDTDLKAEAWVGAVPPGMATKQDGLIGRGVIAPIYAGEAIMETRLAQAGAGGGLAATIPAGMRAVAVRVNEIVGVAGFVVPGMRVDVLIAGTPPGTHPNGPQVKTVLQNIQVLSAGQNFQKDTEGKPMPAVVVNLLVTPEQAELLSLASNETRIQLVLRNPLDNQPAKTPGIAMATLFGGTANSEAKPAAEARPRVVVMRVKEPVPAPVHMVPVPPYQIEVINGATRTQSKFARPTEEKQ
jgi:pilus assembly protein CpaB